MGPFLLLIERLCGRGGGGGGVTSKNININSLTNLIARKYVGALSFVLFCANNGYPQSQQNKTGYDSMLSICCIS